MIRCLSSRSPFDFMPYRLIDGPRRRSHARDNPESRRFRSTGGVRMLALREKGLAGSLADQGAFGANRPRGSTWKSLDRDCRALRTHLWDGACLLWECSEVAEDKARSEIFPVVLRGLRRTFESSGFAEVIRIKLERRLDCNS